VVSSSAEPSFSLGPIAPQSRIFYHSLLNAISAASFGKYGKIGNRGVSKERSEAS
jgi:hypothetical protein